jgi:hypothetical protein
VPGYIGRGRLSHLDTARSERFNGTVLLYALVANDSDFAVDVFPTRELAEQALAEVLADEPAFTKLLTIAHLTDELLEASPN